MLQHNILATIKTYQHISEVGNKQSGSKEE